VIRALAEPWFKNMHFNYFPKPNFINLPKIDGKIEFLALA